jgi:hypothetical protein
VYVGTVSGGTVCVEGYVCVEVLSGDTVVGSTVCGGLYVWRGTVCV